MASRSDATKTALLFLDLQPVVLGRMPPEAAEIVLKRAANAIATGRKHGAQISFVRVALDESDIAVLPVHLPSFSDHLRNDKDAAAMVHPDNPLTNIHDSIAPQPEDLVGRKIRFGPFMTGPSKQLLSEFETRGIGHIVIGGISTGGAVLSSVCQLADLGYRLTVLEDCCTDPEMEMHAILMAKLFPLHAKVINSDDLDALLKA